MIPFLGGTRAVRIIETENRMLVSRGCGEGEVGVIVYGV